MHISGLVAFLLSILWSLVPSSVGDVSRESAQQGSVSAMVGDRRTNDDERCSPHLLHVKVTMRDLRGIESWMLLSPSLLIPSLSVPDDKLSADHAPC